MTDTVEIWRSDKLENAPEIVTELPLEVQEEKDTMTELTVTELQLGEVRVY